MISPKKTSIRKKLMRLIMLVSGIVVFVTCSAFFLYEYFSYKDRAVQKLSTLGEIISNNSTAALAFESHDDAEEILSALKAEPNIVAAAIYDQDGKLFCKYPLHYKSEDLPAQPGTMGYQFSASALEGYQPIVQNEKKLGTLYVKSDLKAMYKKFQLYGLIVVIVLGFSFLLAFLLSSILQKGITLPILELADTATAISEGKDYSLRATKLSNDEIGSLTDSFNSMLVRIEDQTDKLNEFNQKLEQNVNERTKELEAAYKEMEAFTYSVSHDLRAPLRALNGYSKIIKEEYDNVLDDEAMRLLGNIQSNSQKMGALIDDLLSFSKLGKKEIQKNDINTNELVKKVLAETTPNYKAVINMESLPAAKGDYSLLYQVWVNLISNALKYSAKKEAPEVKIGSVTSPEGTIFYVKDNGTGFDMKYYDKLFGVFQRLHDNIDFEGTGIGLAIVDRIISKHKGRIWAEAKPEEGATFYFSLPS